MCAAVEGACRHAMAAVNQTPSASRLRPVSSCDQDAGKRFEGRHERRRCSILDLRVLTPQLMCGLCLWSA